MIHVLLFRDFPRSSASPPESTRLLGIPPGLYSRLLTIGKYLDYSRHHVLLQPPTRMIDAFFFVSTPSESTILTSFAL